MDWENRYQKNDTPWDLNRPVPALVHLFQEKKVIFKHVKNALIPGCGRGHDAIFLAENLPHAKITGLDLSESAVQAARQIDTANLVDWQKDDFLKKLDAPDSRYDMIWEHTCFCAIPLEMRTRYATNAHYLLKPNGFLLGLFYLDPGFPIEEGPPFGASLEELKDIFGNLFVLEWHDPAPPQASEREGREMLILWRRLAHCADGSCAI